MSGGKKISYAAAAVAPVQPEDESKPIPPSKSVIVTILPGEEGRDYGQPDAVAMTPSKRKDLDRGYLADIYISPKPDTDEEPIKLDVARLSSNFICAISPVAKEQIEALPDGRAYIVQVHLPYGSVDAYLILIKWCELILRSGGHLGGLPPLTPEMEMPLYKYYHLLEIVKMLGIAPLVANITHRYTSLTTYESGQKFKIDPDDVAKCYEVGLAAAHPLRKELVDIVALAWKENNLWKKKKEVFEAMWKDNNEFRRDMEARGCTW